MTEKKAHDEPDSRAMYTYLAVLQFRKQSESHEQTTETRTVTAPDSAQALTEVLEQVKHRNIRHIAMYRVNANASVTEFADENL